MTLIIIINSNTCKNHAKKCLHNRQGEHLQEPRQNLFT